MCIRLFGLLPKRSNDDGPVVCGWVLFIFVLLKFLEPSPLLEGVLIGILVLRNGIDT
jgi:hypothetical protein